MKRLELYVVIKDGRVVLRTTSLPEASHEALIRGGRYEKYSHSKQVTGAKKARGLTR
jgi:hypothetical protein